MPLSTIWKHPTLQHLKSRLYVTAPYLFTRRFALSTDLTAQECLDILKAETSPMPEGGATWGVKPIVAVFEQTSLTLYQFTGGTNLYIPIYVRIDSGHPGSMVRGWARMDAGLRLTLAICLLLGAIFPLLVIAKLGVPYKTSDLIAGGLLFVGFPAGLWGFNRITRKYYNETVTFVVDFLAAKLNARPVIEETSLESMKAAPPGPRASIEILVLVMTVTLSVLLAAILGHMFAILLSWFPGGYTLAVILVGLLPLVILLGCAILLLFQDPAFRRKTPSQNSKRPRG